MNIPAIGPARLMYACRLCSARFPGPHGQDGAGMLNAFLLINNRLGTASSPYPEKPFTVAHECGDGRVGLADIAGIAADV